MRSQFEKSFRNRLDSFCKGLSQDPGGIRVLEEPTKLIVLGFLLESACLAQSTEANVLACNCILALPRPWLLKHIEQVAAGVIDTEDAYAFSRLLDLCESFIPALFPDSESEGLMARLLKQGLLSKNPEVVGDTRTVQSLLPQRKLRIPHMVKLPPTITEPLSVVSLAICVGGGDEC